MSARNFTCSTCGKQWPENYCPKCAQTIEKTAASSLHPPVPTPRWLTHYVIPFSWLWASLALTSALLGGIIGGWTLLHCYEALFWLAIGVSWGSILLVPLVVILGAWSWLSGRASVRVFLLHFLTPQLLAVAALLVAYVRESIRTQGAA